MEAGALTGTHAAPGIPKRVTFVDKELPPPIPRGKPLRHQQAFPPCFPSICFFFFSGLFQCFLSDSPSDTPLQLRFAVFTSPSCFRPHHLVD